MQAPESWRARASRSVALQTGQSPSFVSQLKRVERDLDEAQQCVAAHQFEAARQKLLPHLAKLPDPLAGAVYLVLAQCAMRGAGHNWPALLHKSRSAYQAAGDAVGGAHARLVQGMGLFARGDLSQAQTQLTAARRMFTEKRVSWGQAMAAGVQAQVYLAQHDLDAALHTADMAVGIWAYLNEATEEATARQVRAQLLASAGRMQDAARDLLWAERLVGTDASADIRMQLTLGRADSLLWMGYSHRAAAALTRVAEHAKDHPDIPMRAHFHRAMGQALMVDAPVIGAQHLNTAVDLLQKLGQSYGLAQAHIYLACCEHRLGLSTSARIQTARALGISSWPVLRDALEGIERLLQAPPGRLTGPQPPRVFDPDAIDVPSTTPPPRPAAHAQGTIDAQAQTDEAPTVKPWSQWMSRLQQAWGRIGQSQFDGQLEAEQEVERWRAENKRAAERRARTADAPQHAQAHARPQGKSQQHSATYDRAEITVG